MIGLVIGFISDYWCIILKHGKRWKKCAKLVRERVDEWKKKSFIEDCYTFVYGEPYFREFDKNLIVLCICVLKGWRTLYSKIFFNAISITFNTITLVSLTQKQNHDNHSLPSSVEHSLYVSSSSIGCRSEKTLIIYQRTHTYNNNNFVSFILILQTTVNDLTHLYSHITSYEWNETYAKHTRPGLLTLLFFSFMHYYYLYIDIHLSRVQLQK